MDPEITNSNFMLNDSEDLGEDTGDVEKLQDDDILSELIPMAHSIALKGKAEIGNIYKFSVLFPILQSKHIFSELIITPHLILLDRIEDYDIVRDKFCTLDIKPNTSGFKENISEKQFDFYTKTLKPVICNSNHNENSPQEMSNSDRLQDKSTFSEFKAVPYWINGPKNDQTSVVEKEYSNLEIKPNTFLTKEKTSKMLSCYILEGRECQIYNSYLNENSTQDIVNIDKFKGKAVISELITKPCSGDGLEDGEDSDIEKENCSLDVKPKLHLTKEKRNPVSKKKSSCTVEDSKHTICNSNYIEKSPKDIIIINELLRFMDILSDFVPVSNSIDEAEDENHDTEDKDVISELIAKPRSGDGPESGEDSDIEEENCSLDVQPKLHFTKVRRNSVAKRNPVSKKKSSCTVEDSKNTICNSNYIEKSPKDIISINELFQFMDILSDFVPVSNLIDEAEDENHDTEDKDVISELIAKPRSGDGPEGGEDSDIEEENCFLDIKPKLYLTKKKRNLVSQKKYSCHVEDSKHTICNSNYIEKSPQDINNINELLQCTDILPEFAPMSNSIDEAENENEHYYTEDEDWFSDNNAMSTDDIFEKQPCCFMKDTECTFSNSYYIESSPQNSMHSINEEPTLYEFRHLAKTCLALVTGFCVGLLYGHANPYTDISISDIYCAVYFVIYLILYLVFF